MASTDIANLDLIIKLLRMTESSTDGEALNAIRMANAQLRKTSLSWEDLLRGKVTVLQSPWAEGPLRGSTMKSRAPAPSPPPGPTQSAMRQRWQDPNAVDPSALDPNTSPPPFAYAPPRPSSPKNAAKFASVRKKDLRGTPTGVDQL